MTGYRPLRIGVLALQGGVEEHRQMLGRLGATTVDVRLPDQLDGLDGIVLPGGESTVIGKLLVDYGLMEPLRARLEAGLPAYGTCAGMILLAREVAASNLPRLKLMDICVRRNAFGSQLDSFEQDILVHGLEEQPFPAIFIRAPIIERLGASVQILARLQDGTPIAARQGKLLVSAFHPELGSDLRMHGLFLSICA